MSLVEDLTPKDDSVCSVDQYDLLVDDERVRHSFVVSKEARLRDDARSENERNDAVEYEHASTTERISRRVLALFLTFAIEMMPALIISDGGSLLTNVIGPDAFDLFAGFLPLTSAIAGNVGLQCSVVTCRALEAGLVRKQDQYSIVWREVKAGIGLGAIVAVIAALVSGIWFRFSVGDNDGPECDDDDGGTQACSGFWAGDDCEICALTAAVCQSHITSLWPDASCSSCSSTTELSPSEMTPALLKRRLTDDCQDLHGGTTSNAILFGACIGVAQLFGTLTASISGSLAPLLFHFRFKTDPGMWAGPLETCVQDVITSGALTYVSAAVLSALWT